MAKWPPSPPGLNRGDVRGCEHRLTPVSSIPRAQLPMACVAHTRLAAANARRFWIQHFFTDLSVGTVYLRTGVLRTTGVSSVTFRTCIHTAQAPWTAYAAASGLSAISSATARGKYTSLLRDTVAPAGPDCRETREATCSRAICSWSKLSGGKLEGCGQVIVRMFCCGFRRLALSSLFFDQPLGPGYFLVYSDQRFA
jgi:hypothetical protein